MSAYQDNSVATFVQKTFEILRNTQFYDIIHWMHNGSQFIIKSPELFQEIILPKYFRHRNVNSFIRQLNMYCFHKSRKQPSKLIFSHPYFLQKNEDLLYLVRRKIKIQQKQVNLQQNEFKKQMGYKNINKNDFLQRQQQEIQNQINIGGQINQDVEVQKNQPGNRNHYPKEQISIQFFSSLHHIDYDSYHLKSLISKSIIEINTEYYQIHDQQPSLKEIGTQEFLNYCIKNNNVDAWNFGKECQNAIRIFETKNYIFEHDI